MSDQPENPMLVYVRRIDERTECIEADLRDVKRQPASVEEQVANIHQSYAGCQVRFDRMEYRIERIERGLDLQHAPA